MISQPPQAPEAEVAEIAKRHERSSYSDGSLDVASSIFAGHVAHQDRATLLRLLASRQPESGAGRQAQPATVEISRDDILDLLSRGDEDEQADNIMSYLSSFDVRKK